MKTRKISKQRQEALNQYIKARINLKARLRRYSKQGIQLNVDTLTKQEASQLTPYELRREAKKLGKIKKEYAKKHGTQEDILWESLYRKDQQALHNFYKGAQAIIEKGYGVDDQEQEILASFMIWFSKQSLLTQMKILKAIYNHSSHDLWSFIYRSGGSANGKDERLTAGEFKTDWINDLKTIGSTFGFRPRTKSLKNMSGNEMWTKVNKETYSKYVSGKTILEKYSNYKLEELTFIASWDKEKSFFNR